jgi:DNA topoisomerase-3
MAHKKVFIAEKPSVAQDFARALNKNFVRRDGYEESDDTIVTWCFGHLVTMSYPDAYDPKYKKWSLDTIPFIPSVYRYEVIDDPGTKKQFRIVKSILTSKDVDTIYICTDSGREGEYIYRLVATQAGVKDKEQKRVWIDSFTDEEIRRGIREAKDDSAYDNMGDAAYLRAQEDYLMGINFSRALSLKYAGGIRDFLGMDHCVIAVGRVMTCVLGIIVRREREIRAFVPTPFFRVNGTFAPVESDGSSTSESARMKGRADIQGGAYFQTIMNENNDSSGNTQKAGTTRAGQPDNDTEKNEKRHGFDTQWSVTKESRYYESPLLYNDTGFKERKDAEELIQYLRAQGASAVVKAITHKKETKNAPLLYNLAELQNDCSRFFKISPDETLSVAQELYEKKLTTYPRTDARVLSTAVAKEIDKNLKGIGQMPMFRELVRQIAVSGSWKKIGKTRYTNDKAITDHYAIIPTGQGLNNLRSVRPISQKVYELIVRRFLSVFYPPAIFDKMALQVGVGTETLTASLRVNKERGYLDVLQYSFFKKKDENTKVPEGSSSQEGPNDNQGDENRDTGLEAFLKRLKKGDPLDVLGYGIKEGETTPPKRYNSGSMILTMENAGQFIENDELREQIKGSGIGTSATRAGILEKLVNNQYINLNKKTQIYTPTQLGEMIYDAVDVSIRPLLDPKLTASWEKGLTQVAEGTTSRQEYTDKLDSYITRRTEYVKSSDFSGPLREMYRRDAQYYPKKMQFKAKYTYRKGGKRNSSK